MKHPCFCGIVVLGLLVVAAAIAVAQQPVTGIPPLSSVTSGGFDAVDLANLDVHFSIPVFSRPGKGIPFSYSLSYDSLVWFPVTSGSTTSWQPVNNWGWTATTQAATGYATATNVSVNTCYYYVSGHQVPGQGTQTISNWVYHDPSGGVHPVPGSVIVLWVSDPASSDPGGTCEYQGQRSGSWTLSTVNAVATDNSGYKLVAGSSGVPVVTSSQGIVFTLPSVNLSTGAGSVTDPNGNTISISSSNVITDTLGTTALSMTGAAPSPVQYQYTAPNLGTASVTVTYKNYTVTTQFGVSGIAEYSASGVYLVDKVALPDGSYYQFWYETTGTGQPYTAGGAGPVTGRIASVRLPTSNGPVFTYGSSNSMMADGSPAYMTRAFGSGTWTYQRYVRSAQGWCGSSPLQTDTTVIDADGNYTDLYFSGLYPTGTSVYVGARSQSLDHKVYCYNGNTSGCQCALIASTATTPIASRAVFDYPNNGSLYSETDYSYDTYGNLEIETDKDFGTGSNSTLRQTTIAVSSSSSSSNYSLCTTYNICNAPASITITDPANNGATVASTTFTYDQGGGNTHGSVSGISRSPLTGSNPSLKQQFTYNTGGTLASATDPNGTQTTYSYAGNSCNSAFPTSVSVAGLTTSYGYNCTGGVATSVTDPNNTTTSATYSDPYFWRPASTTDALGNTTTYSYSPTQTESVMNFNANGSSATSDHLTTLDGWGRLQLQQTRQGPGSSNFDTTQLIYDQNSRVQWALRPFVSTAGAASGGGLPATGYTYDALGRTTNVTDWTGVQVNYTYSLNDTMVQVVGQPSGENPKSHQYEYDGLGRLKSVCEVTSAGGSGACSQNTSANGFSTSYAYDPLGNLKTVSQSGQTRSYSYDGLSRITSETNPESGTKTYQYDSVGPVACNGSGWTSNGDLLVTVDANGTATCLYSDGLHRVTDVGTNRGGTDRCQRYRYDNTQGVLGTRPSGIAPSHPYGRMVEAATDTCASPITQSSLISDEWFSYDARGAATDYYQSSTNSGGYYHVQKSYAANSGTTTLQGFTMNTAGVNTPFSDLLVFNQEGEGRPWGSWDASRSNYVYWTGTYYNTASQMTSIVFPSSSETFSYDPNSGRMTQWQSKNSGSGNQTGTLTWNANGTLQELAISDNFNSANAQTCSYGYDDLARLLSANCSPTFAQTFSYDAFGNISKSGSFNYNPGYNASNRALTSTYDAVGNTLNDGSNSYSYNADGRPVTVGSTQIVNDAFGRMVEYDNGSSHSQVVYDPQGTRLAKMSGQTLQEYMLPLAGGVQAVFNSSGLWYYRHADWLGSSRLALDTNGNPYAGRAYAPFGETYAETGAADRSFTGQTQDVIAGSTGIYDFLLRQHSAAQGRWLVPDPAGLAVVNLTNPQTWNRYAYVANNPLSNVDPLGLCGEITAGIGMSPSTKSGAALITLASTLGFNVAFPYAGQAKPASGGNIAGANVGLNQSAASVAEAAISATQLDGAAHGSGFVAIGFSGGAEANLSAFQNLGITSNASNTVLLDPGLGIGTSVAAGVPVYEGTAPLSTAVNLWSGLVSGSNGGDNFYVPGCSHDAVCLMGGAQSSAAIQSVSPCTNPAIYQPGKPSTPLHPPQFAGGGGVGGEGQGGGWSYSYGGFFLNGTVETGYSGFFINFGAPAPGGPRWIK